MFDTTSVNTGLHNGIVVRLEKQLERQLLQLPCRHIHELLCAAAEKLVYGDSKNPKEEAFASLIASWPKLDKSHYEAYLPPSGTMQNQCERVVAFCQNALSGENHCLQNDYRELLELAIIFLGKWSLLYGLCHHTRNTSLRVYEF